MSTHELTRIEPGDMRGKICVVTGATYGIGREAALGLGRLGATLLLVGRNAARGEEVVTAIKALGTQSTAAFLPADLSSQAAVRQLADQIRVRYPRVDVLINNAGGVNAERRLTVDGVEGTFAVNHLAPFLLTRLLRDLLVASAPARVVTISSEAHRMLKSLDFDNLQGELRYKPFLAYAVSKLANVLFTYELARQLRGTGVAANCMHPGVVRTGIWQSSRGWLRGVITLAKPLMLSSAKAAKAVVKLAAAPELEGVSGRYFIKAKEVRSSELSYDEAVSAQLWQVSESLIR
jgi:NAD(P)-dependent dehydrogenase (short-subunit alcohol dehydrogenase family)